MAVRKIATLIDWGNDWEWSAENKVEESVARARSIAGNVSARDSCSEGRAVCIEKSLRRVTPVRILENHAQNERHFTAGRIAIAVTH